jgi:acyl-CoA reductase-like NAD-dependent aldehyde dehydrogenase
VVRGAPPRTGRRLGAPLRQGTLDAVSAKEKVLERAPRWSEEQAERALLAAEGGQSPERETSVRARRDLLLRAAAFRARQTGEVDVVALVREGRDELDQRIS